MSNYLHPLNERVRLMLSLEQLFKYITRAKESETYDESLCYLALESVVYLINLTSRYDLNAEFIKELERINDVASDPQLLRQLIKSFHDKKHTHFRQDEFLNNLKQKLHLSGPTYQIDYHRFGAWLSEHSLIRQRDLDQWHQFLSPYIIANHAIIETYVTSSILQNMQFNQGFCQCVLPKNAYLLNLSLVDHLVYPEFSGNQYRMTIRLLTMLASDMRPMQSLFSGDIALSVSII